ncbi:Alpha/Beta hydrolase protein [Aspergillus venezuelensis]
MMAMASPTPTQSASAATSSTMQPALIPIGTHSLWACLSGPGSDNGHISVYHSRSQPCSAGPDAGLNHDLSRTPIVVIIPGAGDVASSYVVLERLLRPFTRVLLYDRSGLGKSEKRPAPDPRPVPDNTDHIAVGADEDEGSTPPAELLNSTSPSGAISGAVQAAAELHSLLQALGLTDTRSRSPLIFFAHSYGGIVAREFLHLYPEYVSGMVLADCSTERANEFFSVPDPNIAAVLGNLNFTRVTGLRSSTVLSDEEWRVRAKEIYASGETSAAEAGSFRDVCECLMTKGQVETMPLGERPLFVLRANTASDYEKIYQAGIEAGNGSNEQRKAFRALLARWDEIAEMLQMEQLRLSSNTRYVHLPDCGHNVHLIRPDAIVEAVRWVRGRVLSRG